MVTLNCKDVKTKDIASLKRSDGVADTPASRFERVVYELGQVLSIDCQSLIGVA
jgi:hypothetical protein